jgi:hypothetical protein
MPSIATRIAVIAAVFISLSSAEASAGNKPPPNLSEPILGLLLDSTAKLDPLPDDVRVLCKRIPDGDSSARLWVFAQSANAGTAYYV